MMKEPVPSNRQTLGRSFAKLPLLTLALAGLLLNSGCKNIYKETALTQSAQRPVLNQNASAYVAVSKDGVDDHGAYVGSGLTTAVAIQAAFAKHFKEVIAGRNNESTEASLVSAKDRNCQYLICPTILQWEDNPTEWSGEPDRIGVKIELLEVASGQIVYGAVINGKSRVMTFGDVPEDLLAGPTTAFANSFEYR